MKVAILATIVLVALVGIAQGHSYLTKPISRSNQKATQTGCRGPACLGPCDKPLNFPGKTAAVTIARGASIDVEWPRNNHAAGFIRLAWAPTSQSDSKTAFDQNIQQYSCHETPCAPGNPNDPNGGDSGPADGSTMACKTSITIPTFLSDGAWTLQWAWFGGAFALGDYFSCVDFTVSGGAAFSAAKPAPVFRGGDFTNPGQDRCKFFNTDELGRCVNEPCDNPKYTGTARSGRPAGLAVATAPPQTQPPSSPTRPPGTDPAPNDTLCIDPNLAPNLEDGDIFFPPLCGNNPAIPKGAKARCDIGQCCSEFGFCGPIPARYTVDGTPIYNEEGVDVPEQTAFALYCNVKSQGDYRLRPAPCPALKTKDDSAGSQVTFLTVLVVMSLILALF